MLYEVITDPPCIFTLTGVQKPVMQAVGARMPELNGRRLHPETAPERRQGNLVLVQLVLHLLVLGIQQ